MNDYKILGIVNAVNQKSLSDLYDQLISLKKLEYDDDERLVIVYHQSQKEIINELLNFVDIPEFFIQFESVDQLPIVNFNLPKKFCIYPWINLRISTVGKFQPCCLFQGTIPNKDIDKDSIKDAYLSDFMKDLRQDFLNGKEPVSCNKCWTEEQLGKSSMRQAGKHKFRDIYYKIDYQNETIDNLQLFDLNLGNSCNLACNICNRESSSTIAEQDYQQGLLSLVDLNNLKHQVKWADTDQFWNQILELAPNIKYLDLYGGEPLMSKTHFNFLKKLIDLGVSKNIKIDYNTNGTVYSEKFFDYWKSFKEIKLSFSIDDIEDRFEQQRVGATWSTVCNNIKKYSDHRSEQFKTELYPTINTQNVFWLPELLDWASTQSFDHTSFNILESPWRYNIKSLANNETTKIIDKLETFTHHDICGTIIKLLKLPKA